MVSLVVATWNRISELERLLASLEVQTFQDFELIVVDQNPDDRLHHLLGKHPELRILHLRSQLGVSRARNIGLRAAQGDIIAIPDDDCWYPPDLLSTVARWFETNPEVEVLFTGMRTADNKLIAPRGSPGPCFCTKKNFLSCVTAVTAFLRRTVVASVGDFNHNLGPGSGSRYGSGEDIDYLLRPLELGFRVWYEPSFTVYHPETQEIGRLLPKAHRYALGVGHVLKVHGYPLHLVAGQVIRSLGGAAVNLFKGDIARAHAYLLRGTGQLVGYVSTPRPLKSKPPLSSS